MPVDPNMPTISNYHSIGQCAVSVIVDRDADEQDIQNIGCCIRAFIQRPSWGLDTIATHEEKRITFVQNRSEKLVPLLRSCPVFGEMI